MSSAAEHLTMIYRVVQQVSAAADKLRDALRQHHASAHVTCCI